MNTVIQSRFMKNDEEIENREYTIKKKLKNVKMDVDIDAVNWKEK